MIPQPTDLRLGRTVRVIGVMPPRPTTVPAVLHAAARILRATGLYRGDYVQDAFDREFTTPHTQRPMSVVAALRCAVSGDPHRLTVLADRALSELALAIDEGPVWGDVFSLEAHVDRWSDAPDRTAHEAAALLDAVAVAALERAA
ncbi:hypothetical protein ACFQ7O_23920 [Streptomyces sp. NPDC056485]|uniref:DUF6197 family protein n=1 Tax=Streptomyces sp. NPDC056485 TaxID=3345834 RepID=UPI00368EA891